MLAVLSKLCTPPPTPLRFPLWLTCTPEHIKAMHMALHITYKDYPSPCQHESHPTRSFSPACSQPGGLPRLWGKGRLNTQELLGMGTDISLQLYGDKSSDR